MRPVPVRADPHNHSPAYAVDFNRTDDQGDPVVASAPDTIDVVADLGGTSYGKYVRINHCGGYTTYCAHLNSFNTAVGAVADGAAVTIYCQTTGTSVTGTYGTSNIWDRIRACRFISDAYVYTGYDGFIPGVPRC